MIRTRHMQKADASEGDLVCIHGKTLGGEQFVRWAKYTVRSLTEEGGMAYGGDWASLDHRPGVAFRWEDIVEIREVVR